MGSVWKAEQFEPVRRFVALKIIKAGNASKMFVARFEAERHALAMMDHPYIARILDGGTTTSGQPYFVMELVDGIPLTTYCDRNRLTLESRLQIFAQVCEAVQHAHQKGVIHRDLKPGNILVAEYDGKPAVKVIDFGLAKPTGTERRLSEESLTEIGQILGTLKYMSPEQAGLNSLDVDTRSDIYSLGVILYELLTGSTPLDNASLKEQAIFTVLEFIRLQEAPKPSSRLSSTDHADLSEITENRRTDAKHLTQVLAGDLDWIVMKAMDKDRSRRYDAASALAADLRQYLAGEPVSARPPSAAYRVRKFVSKHRRPVIAASLLIASLIFGIVGTTLGLTQARSARAQADARSAELTQLTNFQTRQFGNVDLATMGHRLRQQILLQAAQKTDRTDELDRQLDAVNFTDTAADTFSENIIKPAIAAIDSDLSNAPAVKAAMLQSVAEIAYGVGLHEMCIQPQMEALRIREDVFGDNHPDTIESLIHSAVIHQHRGGGDDGYLLRAVRASEKTFGLHDERTLAAIGQLAEDMRQRGDVKSARHFFQHVLDHSVRPSPARVGALTGLGAILHHAGQSDAAVAMLTEALSSAQTLGDDNSPAILSIKTFLAWALLESQRAAEAEAHFRQIHDASSRALGDRHGDTIDALKGLGESLAEQGKVKPAHDVFEQALRTAEEHLGKSHELTVACLGNKARILVEMGKSREAKTLFTEAVARCEEAFGSDHPATLTSLSDLSLCCLELDALDEAEEHMRRTADASLRTFGAQDMRTQQRKEQLDRIRALKRDRH